MGNSTGNGKTAGRLASLLAIVGCVAFFLGIFGAPRILAFTGVALLVLSFAGYFVEEMIERRAN